MVVNLRSLHSACNGNCASLESDWDVIMDVSSQHRGTARSDAVQGPDAELGAWTWWYNLVVSLGGVTRWCDLVV